MFEFYLAIMDGIVKTKVPEYQTKFNNMVYGDNKLSSDEKFYLLGEMQKKWQRAVAKANKENA